MRNFIKLNIIFLGFLIFFSSKSIAADLILPLPKPAVDQETKNVTTAEERNISTKKTN